MRAVPLFCGAMLVLIALIPVQAQVSTYVSRVDAPTAAQGDAASIGIELLPSVNAKRVTIRYRSFGVTEFTEMEMLPAGRSFTVSLPAEVVQPPYLQYYFQMEFDNGATATYPEASAEMNPLQLSVNQVDPRENEVRFLSPEPGETVAAEEFVLAISLYFASPAVSPSKTRVFIDGTDVSREAVLSDDIILWSPANSTLPMKLGARTVRVELRDTSGNVYFSKSRSFSLSTTAAIAEEESKFKASGDVRAEYRHEQTDITQSFARLDARATGTYSFLEFGSTLRLDNLESATRQPQNRYSFYADAEYARLEVGDAYPRFPSLMMVGKRVRGLTGALRLGFFNLDVSFGETERKIQGTFLADTVLNADGRRNRPLNTILVRDSTYEIFSPGTHTRDFFGIRPSFGSGENFQLGFTFLKFKDDTLSVRYAIQPRENLVVGTDLTLAFDDQRIRWETQLAVGLHNRDITGGNYTSEQYDSLEAQGTLSSSDRKLAEQAQEFITVNDNFEPINPAGTGLPGVAVESFLTLNYFNNYVRAQFIRRGTAYTSLGNEFQQSDIQGFVVSDNVRLLSNRLFASVSYEAKADNLSKSKSSTTDYGTFVSALTYNPGIRYPTVQVGYSLGSRLSDQTVFTPDSSRTSKGADDATNRYTIGASYDLNLGVRNFISASLSLVDRADNTINRRDQSSTFLTASVSSYFTAIPLQTTFSVLTSQTSSQSQLFGESGADSIIVNDDYVYTAFSFGGQYRLLNDNLRLTAQVTPTFGDLKRIVFRMGGDYTYQAHVLELYFDFYKNADYTNDSILSFVYRYNF